MKNWESGAINQCSYFKTLLRWVHLTIAWATESNCEMCIRRVSDFGAYFLLLCFSIEMKRKKNNIFRSRVSGILNAKKKLYLLPEPYLKYVCAVTYVGATISNWIHCTTKINLTIVQENQFITLSPSVSCINLKTEDGSKIARAR